MKKPWFLLLVMIVAAASAHAAPETVRAAKAPVTLDSDELEIQENGKKTVFRGHVVLRQGPQTLYADRMVRYGEEGPVEAFGKVRGVAIGDAGEHITITGTKGRYEPDSQQIYLWAPKSRVTVLVEDGKGKSYFEGDEGWADLTVNEAKLMKRVRGRVTPAPSKAPGAPKPEPLPLPAGKPIGI